MLVRIFVLALITNSFALETKNDVCTILSICDQIAAIRSEVAAVRKEQERQANILEGSSLSKISPSSETTLSNEINNELCTILSICNNLAEISVELAAVRVEQARQADLLEESCHTDTNLYPANCYEAFEESQKSGVTVIRVPKYSEYPFKVACDQESHGGGWTIILRRTDNSEDFFRDWADYEVGFGHVDGEHFVGLSKLHALTSSVRQELLVIVEDKNGERYEIYDNFKVGGAASNYTLESVGRYSGTAADALKYHEKMQFSTKDRDNDMSELNCALDMGMGGWWYNACYNSNLGGTYETETRIGRLLWNTFTHGSYPLKTAFMMIRPRASDLPG